MNGTRKRLPNTESSTVDAYPTRNNFSRLALLNQRWSSRNYNDANRYDDDIRLKFLQPMKQADHGHLLLFLLILQILV